MSLFILAEAVALLSQSQAVCQGMLAERRQIDIDLIGPLNVYLFLCGNWK